MRRQEEIIFGMTNKIRLDDKRSQGTKLVELVER